MFKYSVIVKRCQAINVVIQLIMVIIFNTLKGFESRKLEIVE